MAKVDKKERIFHVRVGQVWAQGFGHRIEYGGFQFAAISNFDSYWIYEESSGELITTINLKMSHEMQLGTHDGPLFYLEMIASGRIQQVMDYVGDFKKRIHQVRRENEKRLGKKPATQIIEKEDLNVPETESSKGEETT